MKNKLVIILFLFSFILIAAKVGDDGNIGASQGLEYYKTELGIFIRSTQMLQKVIGKISEDSSSIQNAKKSLLQCRRDYKRIECFLTYFFQSETGFYNAAPKTEVEEPELELVEPMGLQYIETLLFEENPHLAKSKLVEQAEILTSSVQDMPSLLYNFKINDAQMMQSLRLELIRWSTLSIAGFDAPLLKSSMSEIAEASASMRRVIKPYSDQKPLHGARVDALLEQSIIYLHNHSDFDTFNRMDYLLHYALPLQKEMRLLTKDLKLEADSAGFVNYDADNIYQPNALKGFRKQQKHSKKESRLARLGEKLFFDPALSGNLKVSCASCHQKENYFTDLKVRSSALIRDSILQRNTPTLFYAAMQHSQFWDGRAQNLDAQVHDVIFNPLEMGGSKHLISKNILSKKQYKTAFAELFVSSRTPGMNELAAAISAYIKTLAPMNSAFDRALAGNKHSMTAQQVEGFNLFMGKAQCGTCHFPPLFNGLVPPLFDRSELEILGTTKNDDFTKAELDLDEGRYKIYKIHFYKGAFKTPTVRNAAKTFPYMHNGNFSSLEKVVEFYNLGGGKGLGLDVPDQTLSSTPLKLSPKETASIVSFMEALTDNYK
ncbi:cytochrome C peroxidase [Pedobacter psychrodurus]|uniref:Cytochrome C peroxidase n=1 Tax=Pedobacter psychrodurus TaxID=2530456 RepID=A0A4R0PW77_9SPHI|nr:cytochrome c peroxidase [Pedobacter psychrodurus]TCD23393.1 cytochrome C peroxidase [Pedobacter psychrodurus]